MKKNVFVSSFPGAKAFGGLPETLITGLLVLSLFVVPSLLPTQAASSTTISLPWNYTFSMPGTLNQALSADKSGSPHWWVAGGGQLVVAGNLGTTMQGNAPSSNQWYSYYLRNQPSATDKGLHPQNLFQMYARAPQLDTDQSVSIKVNADNLSNPVNRMPWNGILLMSRYSNDSNFYYAGIRQDGIAIIKKKVNGVYYTLAQKAFLPGVWNVDTNPNLIPKNTWMRLRSVTVNDASGNVHVQLFADMNQSGTWQLVLDTVDTGAQGAKINSAGLPGIRTDFMDVSFDNYNLNAVGSVTPTTPTTTVATTTPVVDAVATTTTATPEIVPTTSTTTTPVTPTVTPAPQPTTTVATTTATTTPTPAATTVTPAKVEPTPAPTPTPTPASSNTLFTDTFSQYTDGLLTNEFTYWNPTNSTAKTSVNWEMTSGSLFASGGAGWSGVPNAGAVNALSTGNNNSSVFRLTTNRADFGDVKVEFDLLNQGLSSNSSTPATDWDGVHVFLRYQTEYNLYYASVNRRDNTVIIKKKVPGGPSNNGTYYNLGTTKLHTVPYGSWEHVSATVKNNADGSVTIQLFAGGTLLTSATDNGSIGGAPIRNAGKVGIRGDNDNIKFKNFTVSSFQ